MMSKAIRTGIIASIALLIAGVASGALGAAASNLSPLSGALRGAGVGPALRWIPILVAGGAIIVFAARSLVEWNRLVRA